MKNLFLFLCALSMCYSASAQIRMSGERPKKSNTSSNTIIVKNVEGRLSAGWHGMVDFSAGAHVASCETEGPAIAASVSGLHEGNSGFTFGLTAGYHNYRRGEYVGFDGYDSIYEFRGVSDFRLMAALGWVFGRSHHNGFVLLQPGFAAGGYDGFVFAGDVKLGYRYMFNSHLGIAVSTGIFGIWESTLAVPLTIGFVF